MWPLALANIVREGDGTTHWARLHARQALVLGFVGTAVFFAVLALPLVAVVAIPSLSNEATIAVYGAGLAADLIVAAAWVIIGVRYAARAARGELFAIRWVTPVADRLLRRDGS